MGRNQIIIRPGTTAVYRRQAFLRQSPSTSSSGGRIAELAGGTAAECAAVFCCCPCTIVNLLVLAVYKVPAGLCKKALRRRRRRRLMKKGLLPLPSSNASSRRCHGDGCGCGAWDGEEFQLALDAVPEAEEVAVVVVGGSQMDKELMELEKEMWERFYSTGFWRSPSQREQLRLEELEQ